MIIIWKNVEVYSFSIEVSEFELKQILADQINSLFFLI